MTWLADIGRSGLGSTVMQTAKDFSGLETARQNRQVGLEELRMNQEKSEREKRAFAYEEEKIQKQKKTDEYFVPFDMLFSTGVPGPDGNPIKLDATPTVQGQIIDWAKSMGASSEVGGKAGITIGDSKAVMDMFALRLGWQKMASMGTLQDIDKQKQTIQMTLPTLKGNEAESAKQTMQGLIAREAQVIQGLQIIENKFKERLGDTAERLNQHFARTKGIDLGFTANTTWDKGETMYGRDFAECELAWSSMDKTARMFKKNPNQPDRFHPTQKPVKLYEWLLKNYAKPGDKILDTHLGSGSIAIACWNMGYSLTGYEIDKDYYDAAIRRLDEHKKQKCFVFS